MSFGGGAAGKAKDALNTPHSVYTPFGSVMQRGGDVFLNGEQSDRESQMWRTAMPGIQNILSSFPQLGANESFDNEYTNIFRRQVDKDYGQQSKQLDDNLNARNQLGSSYDINLRRALSEDYNDRLMKAPLFGLEAQGQSVANRGNALGSLSNYLSAAQDRGLGPLQSGTPMFTGYFGPQNNALAGLQAGRRNPLGGAFGGAASGFASGGLPGAVLGGLGGLFS